MKNPELLAPAGSLEALRAAVSNGADGVYLAYGDFNARRRGKNFSGEELVEGIAFCHHHGVSVYLTLNTLLSDRELPQALEVAQFAVLAGVDAIIVQDLGLIQLLKQHLPDTPLHASTQMTIHNLPGVAFCQSLGLSRVVLARELSREAVAFIAKQTEVELEVFAHGALCMSYSGQCFFSALLGERSGNRGLCAQPCRLAYRPCGGDKPSYPLSLKDLSLVDQLEDLRALGIACLKLEGRMKRPEYVAIVTDVYAKALETRRKPSVEDNKRLKLAFSRNGFTDGYWLGRKDASMFGRREEGASMPPALLAQARASYQGRDVPPVAAALPITTSFQAVTPKKHKNKTVRKTKPLLTISLTSIRQLDGLRSGLVDLCYLPLTLFHHQAIGSLLAQFPTQTFAVELPRVVWDAQIPTVRTLLRRAYALGIRDALVGNGGLVSLCGEEGFTLRGDFGLGVFNSASLATLAGLAFASATPSFELNFPQIRDLQAQLPLELLAYGRLPLMLMEHCLRPKGKHCASCETNACGTETQVLQDRRGEKLPLLPAFGGRNELLNGKILFLADKKEDWQALGLWAIRLRFTTEHPREVAQVIQQYRGDCPAPPQAFTRGLYYRRVE